MRTKDEIKNASTISYFKTDAVGYPKLLTLVGTSLGKIKPEALNDIVDISMDVFAKETAIDFDDWKLKNNWHRSHSNAYWCQGIMYETVLTSGQLYDLYLQETSSLKQVIKMGDRKAAP